MIFNLTGGLGNQLFMYAFGRSTAKARNEDEPRFFFQRSSWDYALEPFHLPIEFEEPICVPIFNERSFSFDPEVYTTPYKGLYFKGYWQSEKYFDVPLIRRDFYRWVNSPLRTTFLHKAFIHVRRGDYLNRDTKEFHGELPLEYYQRAINYIQERVPNITFEVFTDDPDLKEFIGYPVVSTGNQHLDLHTMTKYAHGIGANSTYSWWANWLGDYPGRICIFPKKWFQDETINTSDLIPERWIRM
jgi:hypothetical protein